MSSTAVPCIEGNADVLFVELEMSSSNDRVTQLERLDYCVTRADDLVEVFLMRHAFDFSIAVLTDALGYTALRAAAHLVRSQWPKARVLLLGRAPRELQDSLYDASLAHASDEASLRATMAKLVEDPWNQRDDGIAIQTARGRSAPRHLATRLIQESDPSKTDGPESKIGAVRSWDFPMGRRPGVRG